jgi:hypothetical protein
VFEVVLTMPMLKMVVKEELVVEVLEEDKFLVVLAQDMLME